VLTGGGANLQGMAEIAQQIFDMPVRCGQPRRTGSLADHIANPAFATAVGLLVWASRRRAPDHGSGGGPFSRTIDRMINVFKEFF